MRLAGVALALGVLAMIALQASFKRTPGRKEVEETAQAFLEQRRWVGRVAPAFDLTLLDGQHVSMVDLAGKKIVILNFWATWCGPCRQEMPELDRYAKSLGAESVLLLGINVEESRETVAGFLREKPVGFPIGLDSNGAIARAYGVTSYPTTVVVEAGGRIALYETGAILNANVSLDGAVKPGLEKLRHGQGTTKETYLKALESEPLQPRSASSHGTTLEGRAKRIAEAMPCPCGCEDKLSNCECGTARKVKAELKKDAFGEKSDTAIMEELNKRYCMKGMGS